MAEKDWFLMGASKTTYLPPSKTLEALREALSTGSAVVLALPVGQPVPPGTEPGTIILRYVPA